MSKKIIAKFIRSFNNQEFEELYQLIQAERSRRTQEKINNCERNQQWQKEFNNEIDAA